MPVRVWDAKRVSGQWRHYVNVVPGFAQLIATLVVVLNVHAVHDVTVNHGYFDVCSVFKQHKATNAWFRHGLHFLANIEFNRNGERRPTNAFGEHSINNLNNGRVNFMAENFFYGNEIGVSMNMRCTRLWHAVAGRVQWHGPQKRACVFFSHALS
jgi:hypothetical protein